LEGVAPTEFRVLGPVQAVSEGASLPLGGPKQRALLAELLLHGGGVVPRDRLVDAIWGEEPPESAKASLQVYVHGLRRAVGADRIETHGDGYRLRLEPQELDLARFERLVASAERSLGERRVAAAADELSSALALWHGPALADLADQPVARAAAPRLEELRLRALELHNDARLELGEHDALLPELDALVAREPYRERLREQQILALYRAGRQTDALEAYRAARQALVEGLGPRKLTVISVPGVSLPTRELEQLGVARVSTGPFTQRVALTALQDAAAEVAGGGVLPPGTRNLN